ncbi:MAG: carbonic anhydrase [Parvularculaceae bacterium]|nr:carbonic anhydrase [Parvularculaceae bacterium]
MNKIAAGVVKFQGEAYERRKELFQQLAEGQSPEALFITCSDSRIDPNLLTQTSPGELFICRNAGNIVPPHTNHTGAMTASIEFAVGALNVPHIIVCGHSGCGAMQGAMNIDSLAEFPHVREWLNFARAARLIAEEKCASAPQADPLTLLTKENILLQIAHLKTHPYVAARLAMGKVQIHGWYYDIASGDVLAYNEAASDFIPVIAHYRAPVGDMIHHRRS